MTKRFNTIDGETLMTMPLKPINFIIDNLLSEGLHILAGSPKVGKSWLALWLSVAVAKGEEVWGNKVKQGNTLYLCFEDSQIRIQNRLFDITDEATDAVNFCTENAMLGGELEERIINFIKEHPDTVLIIIDTLQMIRNTSKDNNYANDYSELTILKNLADKYGIAILLIHHLRKEYDKDPFKDRNGQVSSFEYKESTNYLAKQTTGGLQLSYTYDNFGNIKTATNSNGTTEYNYKFNNLLETIRTNGKTITYGYDANKNVNSVKDYFGAVTSYTHDGLNRLKTVARGGTAVASYDYYQFGTLQKITYPGQGISEFSYDNALRLTSQTNMLANGTELNIYSYQYDLNGNQTKKTDNGAETSYVYDSLGRLTNVNEPDGTNTEYRFDEQSNISNKKITHSSSYEFQFKKNDLDYSMSNVVTHEINYAYDKNNRLKFEGEYIGGAGELFAGFLEIEKFSEYDNNGNLVSTKTGGQIDESMVEYTYNPLNQLTQFKDADDAITDYTYNPDGMRQSKITKGVTTQFYWDRGYISNEETNNVLSATNFIGVGGIFGRQTPSGTSFMLKNGHGDVVSLVSGGEEIKTYDYTAYGVEKEPDPNDTNPFRYCAEYWDNETGNIYLRNRYYSPNVGRFISEDLIRDGWNWYVYSGNNPIMFIDPWGLAVTELDITAYYAGLLTSNDIELIKYYTNEHINAEKANDYAAMNAAHSAVADIRLKYDSDYIWNDEYDYTHGGRYFAPGNDTVSDEGWIITAAAVGIATGIKLYGTASAVVKSGSGLAAMGSSTVAIGTSFGKLGTLIENPGITIQNISKHALDRMAERGVTQQMLDTWTKNGKALEQAGGRILYVAREGVAVVSKTGDLITTYGKNNFDATMQNVVEQLFGK